MPSIQLALLVCQHFTSPIRDIHGGYPEMYTRLLADSLALVDSETSFILDSYDVFEKMEYPPDAIRYDGLLISGSSASAYDDVEWINKLVAYIKRIFTEKPTLKIFGICFGHQIIARTLGGTCTLNPAGWELAMTSIPLTSIGKAIFGVEELDLYEVHKDHVTMIPPDAHLIGWSDITPVQGMVVFDPALVPSPKDIGSHIDLTSIHVLTLQSHPEFVPSTTSMLLDLFKELDEKLLCSARHRLSGQPGRYWYDGIRVGKVIWDVLGLPRARMHGGSTNEQYSLI